MSIQEGNSQTDNHNSTKAIWIEVIVVLVLLYLPSVYGAIVSFLDTKPATTSLSDPVYSLISDGGMIGLLLFLMFRLGGNLPRFGFKTPKLVDLGIGLFFVPVTLVLHWFVLGLHWILQPEKMKYWTNTPPIPITHLLVLLVVWAVGAACEETLYRSYLITRFSDLTRRVWVAIFLSALLFGSIHIYNGYFHVLDTIISGCIFGYVFYRSRSVWPAIVTHFVFNAIVISGLCNPFYRFLFYLTH